MLFERPKLEFSHENWSFALFIENEQLPVKPKTQVLKPKLEFVFDSKFFNLPKTNLILCLQLSVIIKTHRELTDFRNAIVAYFNSKLTHSNFHIIVETSIINLRT